ncbi:NUDIX hydrolase [Amycolatopsis sp. NBC_00438]|uniref:NUDIX hydrolase n=1 Tax=Amycolatopsis sp. NBC_00438 TaxID=2903558 RepID=UPI002E2515E5
MPERVHETLRLAVDLVILTVRERSLQMLVIERANKPFQGRPALPGGFLRSGEDLRAAAERELAEETGLDGGALHLEQLATYGAPERDPRGRVVSVAYLAIAPDLPIPTAGSDAAAAAWAPVDQVIGDLAFDHPRITQDAVDQARTRLELTTLATVFCGTTFTMAELRTVYEVVWGSSLDQRNFSRKVLHTAGFVEPTGEQRVADIGRPAALYRRGKAKILTPPILRGDSAR